MAEHWETKLKEKGIRPTAMRLLVLKALQKQSSAISLSTLEDAFQRSDRITLYRTLKTFQEKGLVHSVDDGTGAPKYALCENDCNCDYQRDLHVHFHCYRCNETFCLPRYKIPEVLLPENFKATEANLVVKGTCARCID